MARISTERLGRQYDQESRRSASTCTLVSNRSQHSPSKNLQMWYNAGFKGGGVFAWSLVLLYST